MVRSTSLNAFNTIKNDGLLSKTRFYVYEALFEHGPLTALECASYLENTLTQGSLRNVNARLGELRDLGVVREMGKRVCSRSQLEVILWDVTPYLPTKPKGPTWQLLGKHDTFQEVTQVYPYVTQRHRTFKIETRGTGNTRKWYVFEKIVGV